MAGEVGRNEPERLRSRILEILKKEGKLISYLENTSHQMRTPMTLISSYTELILAGMYGPLTDDMREKMEMISSNLEEMSYFVDQVQDIGYLANGRETGELKKVDIRTMVDNVAAEISLIGKQRNVKFELENMTRPVEIPVDEHLARRALSHLLRYVVSTAPFGARIKVALKEGEERTLIIVFGFGQMMDQDRMASIVRSMSEKDARLTTMEWEKLSLPIAKALMEVQKGDLTVFEDEDSRCVYVLEFSNRP